MNGNLEFVKWFAFVLMLGDHINAALFDRQLPVLSEVARVVFPLFVFVMAVRLASVADPQMSVRLCKRLLLWAAIAQPFHVLAFGYWIPVNVLATLAVGVGVVALLERGRWMLAAYAFIGFAGWVDYAVVGPALVVASWAVLRAPGRFAAWLAWSASFAGLCAYNGSLYALAAVPLLGLLVALGVEVRRVGRGFYGAYAGHLAALALAVWGAGVPPAVALVMSAPEVVDGARAGLLE